MVRFVISMPSKSYAFNFGSCVDQQLNGRTGRTFGDYVEGDLAIFMLPVFVPNF